MNKNIIAIFLFVSALFHCTTCFSNSNVVVDTNEKESLDIFSLEKAQIAEKIICYFDNLKEMSAGFVQMDAKNKKNGSGNIFIKDDMLSIVYLEPKEFTIEYSNFDHVIFYSERTSSNKRTIKINSDIFDLFFCKNKEQLLSSMSIALDDGKIAGNIKNNSDEIFVIFNVEDNALKLSSIQTSASKFNATMILNNLNYIAK